MKTLKGISLVAILLVSPFFFAKASSGARNSTIPGSKMNAGIISSKATIVDTGGKKVEEFKKEWNKKIEKLNKKISSAEKKVNNSKAEDKGILEEKISDWKAQKEDLQQEINRAGDISASKWKVFKSNVENKYSKLNKSIDTLYKGR
jgi:hypothetical protein